MRRKILLLTLSACAFGLFHYSDADACTNIIVTPGASADSSSMVSYAADSHWLYGELYYHPARRYRKGATLDITEWDTYKPLGSIPQVRRTFQTVGNMNERQLIIGETTFGGREELVDSAGIMDYGSLIYITLQRAGTVREAIQTIVSLANEYGYPSEGESFSIADPNEAWVMDLIGKGPEQKGIVWVARRIPDGFICAHANQSRITRFPLNDPQNCLYAPDVISFAREKGYFSGADEDFSFRDAYNPLDFGGARACDARVWAAFRILCDGVFTYIDNEGREVSASADDWTRYAMGYDLSGEMPLFVKPQSKLCVKDVADVMRDHFEGTPMDMTQDIGAGGNALPYRWRPMDFEVDGKTYVNERAIATQQTGFWFVGQSRRNLPDEVGGIIWFGCDDAATSYVTPIYTCTKRIPECFRVGNGDLLHYSPTSAFWMCNRISNACYKMYDNMAPFVRSIIDRFEDYEVFVGVPSADRKALKMRSSARRKRFLTRFSIWTAQKQFEAWTNLEETLLVKYLDGNVKAQEPSGEFSHSPYHIGTPEGLTQPGYTDKWKAVVAADAGSTLLQP